MKALVKGTFEGYATPAAANLQLASSTQDARSKGEGSSAAYVIAASQVAGCGVFKHKQGMTAAGCRGFDRRQGS